MFHEQRHFYRRTAGHRAGKIYAAYGRTILLFEVLLPAMKINLCSTGDQIVSEQLN
jgi:hypothetical protein